MRSRIGAVAVARERAARGIIKSETQGSADGDGPRGRSWRRPGMLAGIVLLGLIGCEVMVNPLVPPPGGTPAFNDGYVDGCWTGLADAGREGYYLTLRKDARRYASDADYKSGFDQAYPLCYEEERRHPKIVGGGNGKSD